MKKKGNADAAGTEARGAEDGTPRRGGKKKPTGGAKKAAPAKQAAERKAKPAAKKPARGKAGERSRSGTEPQPIREVAEPTEPAIMLPPDFDEVEDADIVAETPAEPPRSEDTEESPAVQAEPMSAEEIELSAIYGTDVATPAIAHGEYQDRQTADEDRPMMPEINARDERKQRWEDRRDRRKSRREERDRDRQQRREDVSTRPAQPPLPGQPQQRPQEQGRPRDQRHFDQRPQGNGGGQPRPQLNMPLPVPVQGQEADGHARVGTPLGDAAAAVFQQLRNGQPMPVRQLAAMMRKRSLVNQDPEQLWPQLKAELLGDERSYRALGLRPRIVYRGRDLFAPGPVAMSTTADAEAGVANALSRLQSATHKALSVRIAKASAAGFERLIHGYLVAAGYRDIEWVKRVGGISYAAATAPGLERTILISARSGDQPIDRRGIGELRVGVEAKNLVAGILFSARELSEDAERELERAGRSISVVCGDQLVAAFVHAGVGVVSAAAPLHYLDDQLLDELLAG
jgi:hypothetical protein